MLKFLNLSVKYVIIFFVFLIFFTFSTLWYFSIGLPDYKKLTPFLKKYIEHMGWDDLNWLEDVHMGYENGKPAVFDRNINGWVTTPKNMKLPKDQQDRDMIARELLVKFQMSPNHPLVVLKKAYQKFD